MSAHLPIDSDLDKVFIRVNGKRTSVAAFLAMDKLTVKTVDARGCAALTSLDVPAAAYVFANGCTALTSLSAPAATRVDASGCAALTSLDVPAATIVDASDCTALTSLSVPAATYVYARGCTALTSLDVPAATAVYARGCTALTSATPDAPFYAGADSRGYGFLGLTTELGRRVFAGCRNFTLAQACAHWGPEGESNRPDCLALVEKIAAHWGDE